MGFKSVYRVLIDVFPQVDNRILRAVAIENSKDADKAVEVVLMEVIPSIANSSASANESLNKSSSEECGSDGKLVTGPSQSTDGPSAISNSEDEPSNIEYLVESNLEQLFSNVNSLDVNESAVKLSPSAVLDFPPHAPENNLQQANDDVSEETYISDAVPVNYNSVTEVVDLEHEPIEERTTHELVLEHEPIEERTTHELVLEHEPVGEKSTDELDFEQEDMGYISSGKVVELVDEHTLETEVSRSGQICRIDLLEDIIEEARDNKKTLFSAMESVMSLMREVEVREKEAEKVKEEAATGPLDILASVESLKQMLRHAREANDMHAGEVYGEKAILATEAKELQSRLLCLSDERDNSLAILDEMRQTLEERLIAAEKELKAAEEEKIEKEELARNALAEQQLLMDKLVQESKMLKQEAEENSKLQEFLMDRGSVVDILQGEISVICKDVKLLKQKFDEKVPLSESLSSSQTSCRLASSSSSLKSLPIDQIPVQIETALETSKMSDRLSSGEEIKANDREALVYDDGWELCDNKQLNM